MASQAFTRSRLALPLMNTARITARQNSRPFPQTRALGRPRGEEVNNPLEDPREDLGGPGGQELYPVSMALHKYAYNFQSHPTPHCRRCEMFSNTQKRRYAAITAAWVMAACGVMYLAKRIEWAPRDPD